MKIILQMIVKMQKQSGTQLYHYHYCTIITIHHFFVADMVSLFGRNGLFQLIN